MRSRIPIVRLGRIVALAVVIAIGINHVWWAVADWHLSDMNAYWEAALRLRSGEPLYPSGVDIEASSVYRYSPWFAWLWVPVTYLPRMVANVGWSVLLLAASGAAMLPLVRRGSLVAVAFFLPMLVGISAIGNAHPLLIAALVLGVERRSGPLWIALAASLKIFPLLFVLTYLGRRQWLRATSTAVLTVVALAPFLLYDLSSYVTEAGGAALLWRWPPLYAAALVVAGTAAVWLARSRFGWLASSATVALSLPRFFVYDATYLAVALPRRPAADQDPGDGDRQRSA